MTPLIIFLFLFCSPTLNAFKCVHKGDDYYTQYLNNLVCGSNPDTDPLFGDFNGDGRADYFCDDITNTTPDQYGITDKAGTIFILIDAGTNQWCDSTIGKLFTADIDGNGRDDLICRYNDDSRYEVSFYNGHGFSSPTQMFVSFACDGSAQQLLVGDVNGDGAEDFICHDNSIGALIISYNSHHFRGRRHSYQDVYSKKIETGPLEFKFCQGSSKTLTLGDVNGDKTKDMICHDPSTGTVEVSLASRNHPFHNFKSYPLTFCTIELYPTHFKVMDIDGDHLEDFVCLKYQSGDTFGEEVILSDSKQLFNTPSYDEAAVQLCANEKLIVADINGDNMADLYCDLNPFRVFFSVCIGL